MSFVVHKGSVSISPVLGQPWILDIDTTVKCLYGHQEGAQIGYNPRKPGRPCHVYHSYFVANLRISLGVEVHPGKEHAAPHGMPGFWSMLEGLPRDRWPTFVRGDCGYGSEKIMRATSVMDSDRTSVVILKTQTFCLHS